MQGAVQDTNAKIGNLEAETYSAEIIHQLCIAKARAVNRQAVLVCTALEFKALYATVRFHTHRSGIFRFHFAVTHLCGLVGDRSTQFGWNSYSTEAN